jgi:hypothetical protein
MKNKPRVELDLLKIMTGKKEVIRRKWMKEDPVLSSMTIMRMAQSTNYLLSDDEHDRLSQLVMNTGVPWSRAESLAALWLYNDLYVLPISRTADSPAAQLAVRIGRAVSGVYNKLMNFRSIDPREDREGLSGAGRVDREVWNTYFENTTQTFLEEQLSDDFKRIWGGSEAGRISTDHEMTSIPAEAPNDIVRERKSVSALVRKGQSVFRKRLIHLYDGKCAMSGVDVEAALDAAHIDDYATSGVNASTNGLLLRSDLHDLFDAGLIVIDPDTLTISIDPNLRQSYYGQFEGKKLRDRNDGERPSRAALAAKRRTGG